MDSLNGLSRHRLRWPSSAARADGHSACHRGVDCHAPDPGRSRTAITGLSVHELPSTQSTLVTRLHAAPEHRRPAPTLRLIFHMDSGGAVHRWRRGARRPQHARGQPLLGGQTYLPFEISKMLSQMIPRWCASMRADMVPARLNKPPIASHLLRLRTQHGHPFWRAPPQ